MYNVLIADDEPSIRNGMKIIIDWSRYNFRVQDTAADGLEAFEKLKRDRYNLVITDIRMPHMDGLEFIKQVKGHNPLIRILIISGYSDFAYAKKAMEYGVKDYLLKPIDDTELIDAVTKIKAELDHELRHEMVSKETEKLLRDKLLYDFVRSALTLPEISEFLTTLNITPPKPFVGVALLEIEGFNEIIGEGIEKARLLIFGIRNILEETLEDEKNFYVYQDTQAILGIVMFMDKNEISYKNIKPKLLQLSSNIDKYMKTRVTIGVGGFESCDNAKTAWKHANLALERKALIGDRVINYEQVGDKKEFIPEISWETKNLMEAVEYNNRNKVKTELDEMAAELTQCSATRDIVLAIQYNILFGLLKLIKLHNGDGDEIFKGMDAAERLFDDARIDRVSAKLYSICVKSGDYVNKLKSRGSTAIIDQIKAYIDNNYREDLSLKLIAGIFYLTPAYLGQLFKNTVKQSFSDYINRLRISEAKRIIQNGDVKIKELIELVGYANPEYFYKMFKKVEGITYQEYKKSHSS